MAEDTKKSLQTHLDPFLKKCHLGKTISRYMVLVATSGNADAKQLAFKTADIQNYSAMAATHSNFQLN
ncbi:MAG: hypothetical protein ACYC67_15990 [Prosthecobacter sp.]